MYLSNNREGRPSRALYQFKRADLDGRRQIAEREHNSSLVIWQLHECASSAPLDPFSTLSFSELAIELAAEFDDPDLLSWAHSELGNIHRLLADYDSAKHHLERGISLAVSPYQQADANRQRGVLPLTMQYDSAAAFRYLDRAFQISSKASPRIYTDRGHPIVLQSKALAHYYHALLHEETHVEQAILLLEAVLNTACRRHARRSRRAALNNLVTIPLIFDRPVDPCLIDRLICTYNSLREKSSLLGARIRWALIRVEIREEGYTEARRRRLLTVRSHIAKKGAFRVAGLLTLDIAAHDITVGRPRRVRLFLEASRPLLEQGGLEKVSCALLSGIITEEEVLGARREALLRSVLGRVAARARVKRPPG